LFSELNEDDDDDENQHSPQIEQEMEIDAILGGVDKLKTLAMQCVNARGPRISPSPEVDVEEKDQEDVQVEDKQVDGEDDEEADQTCGQPDVAEEMVSRPSSKLASSPSQLTPWPGDTLTGRRRDRLEARVRVRE
jgi:hypothetical protein